LAADDGVECDEEPFREIAISPTTAATATTTGIAISSRRSDFAYRSVARVCPRFAVAFGFGFAFGVR
jgi:hypothetical protein